MPTVFAQIQKITNAKGRHEYLTDPERQEDIVLAKESMQYSWQQHSDYEISNKKTNTKNNEALEIVIKLPNDLHTDKRKLEQVCDDLSKHLVGDNHDHEYAVHWNKSRTNLHMHLLFSERENNIEVSPKVYKKDIWQDKDTHKLAKANDSNAELVHKKGEIQKDKDGNIKYDTDIFKPKDTKFKERWWLHHKNKIIKDDLKRYGYDLDLHDGIKDNPYLSQKKLHKGASSDYIKKAREWNNAVLEYNENVKEHISIEPVQLDNYVEIKKEILSNVKEANKEEKKITSRAIEMVKDMTSWVKETVNTINAWYMTHIEQSNIMQKFKETKDKFADLFKERSDIQKQKSAIEDDIREMRRIDNHLGDLIKDTNDTIEDLTPKRSYGYDHGISR